MNLETKITIYKFTPQLFTLTPWRISLSLQLLLESSKHLCPHALTANITS
jgi:hypothetical protein